MNTIRFAGMMMLAAAFAAVAGGDEQADIRGLLDEKKYAEALAAASALNKRVPDNVAAYELLAEAQFALGKVQEAEKSAQWMLDLKLGKVTPSGSRIIAKIRRHYKDDEGAIEILTAGYKAIGAGDESLRAPILLEIAELYRKTGKGEAADRVLEQLKKIAGQSPASQTSVEGKAAADSLQKLRETSDPVYLARAAKLVRDALDKDPNDQLARICEMEVHLHKHEFRTVLDLGAKLSVQSPRDPRVAGMMGDAHMELGEYDAAANAYDRMLRLKPSLASYNRAAHFRYVTGDLEGAIDLMHKAARIGGAYPENTAWCWVETGNLLLKKNAIAEAVTAFQTALETFPNYHAAIAGLGRAAAASADTTKAVAYFRRATQIVPLPDYVGGLYAALLQAGDPAGAEKEWQLLEQIDKLGRATGELTNRKVALLFADYDRQLPRALELTTAELSVRQDVFTLDAHAWALYKNGRQDEAREFMKRALAQNTKEPAFEQHARLILGEQWATSYKRNSL